MFMLLFEGSISFPQYDFLFVYYVEFNPETHMRGNCSTTEEYPQIEWDILILDSFSQEIPSKYQTLI